MRTACVRAYGRISEGRRKKNSRGFVFLFRFASFPFPVFTITIYKPAPAKTLHSTAPGPEVFAQCQPRTSVRRRTPKIADLFSFSFFFFFFCCHPSTSYPRAQRKSGRDDGVGFYIGMFYVFCHRISRRYALPHVYLYLYL